MLKIKPPHDYLLVGIGCVSVSLGVIGIFLPLMPTTCFILLAAWCFSRSSNTFHSWLVGQKYLGPIVIAWEQDKGIEPPVRNRILCVLWSGLLLSMFIVPKLWVVGLLLVVGVSVSAYLVTQTREGRSGQKTNTCA